MKPTQQAADARREIGKWLNDNQTKPIDKEALARLCAGFDAIVASQTADQRDLMQVPAGYKLVIIEPTDHMIDEGARGWEEAPGGLYEAYANVYRYMLEASQPISALYTE